MLLNNFLCILRFYLGIKCIVGNYFYNRSLFTKTKTAGTYYLGIVTEPLIFDFGAQVFCQDLALR